ncbi:unnamed protein product [Leptosia nina]|uniref:Uncharacterized protein n=1 Tax=Leptosia nina TaxID=320188 RepID=A0AAV1IWT5_9NEOP
MVREERRQSPNLIGRAPLHLGPATHAGPAAPRQREREFHSAAAACPAPGCTIPSRDCSGCYARLARPLVGPIRPSIVHMPQVDIGFKFNERDDDPRDVTLVCRRKLPARVRRPEHLHLGRRRKPAQVGGRVQEERAAGGRGRPERDWRSGPRPARPPPPPHLAKKLGKKARSARQCFSDELSGWTRRVRALETARPRTGGRGRDMPALALRDQPLDCSMRLRDAPPCPPCPPWPPHAHGQSLAVHRLGGASV